MDTPVSRAHKLLQELLASLDRALPGASQKALKDRLMDRGTTACALARLGTADELIDDLTAMRAELSESATEGADDAAIGGLRRLIDACLAELRGH